MRLEFGGLHNGGSGHGTFSISGKTTKHESTRSSKNNIVTWWIFGRQKKRNLWMLVVCFLCRFYDSTQIFEAI